MLGTTKLENPTLESSIGIFGGLIHHKTIYQNIKRKLNIHRRIDTLYSMECCKHFQMNAILNNFMDDRKFNIFFQD
jgi:hypothetical protein